MIISDLTGIIIYYNSDLIVINGDLTMNQLDLIVINSDLYLFGSHHYILIYLFGLIVVFLWFLLVTLL